jgi:hypothetical protein
MLSYGNTLTEEGFFNMAGSMGWVKNAVPEHFTAQFLWSCKIDSGLF